MSISRFNSGIRGCRSGMELSRLIMGLLALLLAFPLSGAVCVPGTESNCTNALDDDGDGLVDCDDQDCSESPSCQETPAEICTNEADDDGDSFVDCDDLDCSDDPACANEG